MTDPPTARRKGAYGPQRVNERTDIVFSFDAHDAPCLDVYTNQVSPKR